MNSSGDADDENAAAIPLTEMKIPPPSYEHACELAGDDDPESSRRLLNEDNHQDENNDESMEEKQKKHSLRIQKLMRDLEQDKHSDDVSPEEIEMLDVGSDHALPDSEMVSVASVDTGAALSMTPGAALDDSEDDVLDAAADGSDASIRRMSRRLSLAEMRDVMDDQTEENDEEPKDEASVEDGCVLSKCDFISKLLASRTKMTIVLVTVLVCLVLLTLVILLPVSFVSVEYHEYAMSRSGITGKVDYDEVMDSGCYLLFPGTELVRFNATAHFMTHDIEVLDDTGLTIGITFILQYFLNRDDVPQMYQRYHKDYDPVLRSIVESEVKNVAAGFNLTQYRHKRAFVEQSVKSTVRRALNGHGIDVRYFQLGAITIPEDVLGRFSEEVVLEVEAETELYRQGRALELKITEQVVQDIKNRASERIEDAKAEAGKILVEARADRNVLIEKAQQKALRQAFQQFHVKDEADKLSFIYAKVLAEKEKGEIFTHQGFDGSTLVAP